METPTEGEIFISGESKVIGYCPQSSILYDNMTVEEHLEFYARLKKDDTNEVAQDVLNMMREMKIVHKADVLSKKVPTWSKEFDNPINFFVPECEQSYKAQTEEVLMEHSKRQDRSMKLTTLAGKERTLQLAGTMALGKRKMSPLSKLRETRGMVTIKRVPDVFEQKNSLA